MRMIFEKGDRVKVINRKSPRFCHIGFVLGNYKEGEYLIGFGGEQKFSFNKSELELIQDNRDKKDRNVVSVERKTVSIENAFFVVRCRNRNGKKMEERMKIVIEKGVDDNGERIPWELTDVNSEFKVLDIKLGKEVEKDEDRDV